MSADSTLSLKTIYFIFLILCLYINKMGVIKSILHCIVTNKWDYIYKDFEEVYSKNTCSNNCWLFLLLSKIPFPLAPSHPFKPYKTKLLKSLPNFVVHQSHNKDLLKKKSITKQNNTKTDSWYLSIVFLKPNIEVGLLAI